MDNFLVISALGADRPGIVDELARAAAHNHCSIADSRMIVMGQEFAIIMMVAGADTHISALESLLPSLGEKLGLAVITKRTSARGSQPESVAYHVDVVALDNPGIVHDIANFFASQHINIEAMETSTYSAPHTGSPMFELVMTVNIPARLHIATLREQFVAFCDERNLDAVIEPYKS